jgi:hypothetical protein
MLPPVQVANWLRLLPRNAAAAFVPLQIGQPNPVPQLTWSLVLPNNLMFYRMPSSAAVIGNPYIPNALPALQDYAIDLEEYQRDIDVIL